MLCLLPDVKGAGAKRMSAMIEGIPTREEI
jgi:hypothetical protein